MCCCCGTCCAMACCATCSGPFCMTYLAAIVTGIESVFFLTLNIYYIMGFYCSYVPSEESLYFVQDIYSWFIYSESCDDPPDWIVDIPKSFTESNLWSGVSPYTAIYYQTVLAVLNCMWLISCALLIYGNSRRIPKYYVPWMIIGKIILLLDICLGTVYIIFMTKIEYGDNEWFPLFSMILYYFKGFFFVICNFFMICFVTMAFTKIVRKRKKETKLKKDITVIINTTVVTEQIEPKPQIYIPQLVPVQINPIPSPTSRPLGEIRGPLYQSPLTSGNQQMLEVNPTYSYHNAVQDPTAPPYSSPITAYNPAYVQNRYEEPRDMKSIDKYQPFSYTNPAVRQDSREDIPMSKLPS